ncbi:MAG: dihydrolipoamide acetyltransferase family protein [Xanthobacteraceae bacterium]
MNILMPQLGETVAEGKITAWFKTVGEAVKPGDNLFEIETDKTSMEVPATSAGVLSEIRVPAGTVVPVGVIVAVLAEAEAQQNSAPAGASPAIAPPPTKAPAPAPARPLQAEPAPRPDPARALPPLDPFHPIRTPPRNFGPARLPGGRTVTPLARRLAAEAGIDLSRITSSGPHGRIVARDIESARARGMEPVAAVRAGGLTAERVKAVYAAGSYEEIALDSMRRTIAARLVEAKQTVPHFYLSCDVALDRLEAVRTEANAAAGTDADGAPAFKLSLNDFLIKALAHALQRVPAANAVWAEDRILRFRSADIAVAVALDGGLITPMLRDADTKTLSAISAEMKRLAARARERRLQPAEYQGGVATLSNLGMYGVREFAAIINPPQSSLLAVGAAERRPVETDDGGVRFETRMTATLSCDHRVIDGALGAELLAAFKRAVEHPIGLLV